VASFSRDFSTAFLFDEMGFLACFTTCCLASLTFIKSSLSAGQKFCTVALADQSVPAADEDKLGSVTRK